MKVDMTNYTVEEIISHLEIYGDDHGGAIIKVIKSLEHERDCALDDVTELELADNDDEVYELQSKNDELEEKLEKIDEILNGDN